MNKIILVISIISFFSLPVRASSIDHSDILKFIPSRDLAFMPMANPKRVVGPSESLVFLEGHNFVAKPINKEALKGLDFLISIKVPY